MKKLLIIALLAISLVACTDNNQKGIKMQPDITEQNRKVVDNFFVALETQKFEMLKEVFAENGNSLIHIHRKVSQRDLTAQKPSTNNTKD